jgi:hypothetical protein
VALFQRLLTRQYMVVQLFLALTVSIRWRLLFPTLCWSINTIDLVLIDPQSVAKRPHDLMDTVNAKKRWKTICWRVNTFVIEPLIDTLW